jgi:hypothetical protein
MEKETDDDDDVDDEFMDNSFYIGEEDGFRNSSSIHESDISETDSEAYENDHRNDDNDDDDDVQHSKEYEGDDNHRELPTTTSP